MQETEFYRQVLGLCAPWKVTSVKLDIPAGQVRVQLEHASGVRWRCPECERELACYNHSEERTWRHLDTCQLQTLLVARLLRFRRALTHFGYTSDTLQTAEIIRLV